MLPERARCFERDRCARAKGKRRAKPPRACSMVALVTYALAAEHPGRLCCYITKIKSAKDEDKWKTTQDKGLSCLVFHFSLSFALFYFCDVYPTRPTNYFAKDVACTIQPTRGESSFEGHTRFLVRNLRFYTSFSPSIKAFRGTFIAVFVRTYTFG